MSPVVRQRLPMLRAQSRGRESPHSQMLNTIGRPIARSASLIVRYDATGSCVPVLHQSYFK
jgi:hypothetical protein